MERLVRSEALNQMLLREVWSLTAPPTELNLPLA